MSKQTQADKLTAEQIKALKIVIAEGNKVHSLIGAVTDNMHAAIKQDPVAWAHSAGKIQEQLRQSTAQATEASLLLAKYKTGDHSNADVGLLMGRMHNAAKTFVEASFEIHKFIRGTNTPDISEDLFQAAQHLEEANRALALHM